MNSKEVDWIGAGGKDSGRESGWGCCCLKECVLLSQKMKWLWIYTNLEEEYYSSLYKYFGLDWTWVKGLELKVRIGNVTEGEKDNITKFNDVVKSTSRRRVSTVKQRTYKKITRISNHLEVFGVRLFVTNRTYLCVIAKINHR